MLTINLGDMAGRIARSLGVRGRIPSSLDEVMVPVVTAFDLTSSLFAQNPYGWAGFVAGFADGVNPFSIRVSNETPRLISRVRRVTLGTSTAAGEGVSLTLVRGQVLGGGTVSTNVVRTNGQTPIQLPPNTIIRSSNNVIGAGTSFYNTTALIPPGTYLALDIDVVLYPNDQLKIVTNGVAATDMVSAFIQGDEFLTS